MPKSEAVRLLLGLVLLITAALLVILRYADQIDKVFP